MKRSCSAKDSDMVTSEDTVWKVLKAFSAGKLVVPMVCVEEY